MSETKEWPTKLRPSRRRLIIETVATGAEYYADRDEWRMPAGALEAAMEQAFNEGRLSGLMED